MFSGEFWTGTKALDYGIVDRLGDLRFFLREQFGDKVVTPLIAERGLFGRRSPASASRPTFAEACRRKCSLRWKPAPCGRATDCEGKRMPFS